MINSGARAPESVTHAANSQSHGTWRASAKCQLHSLLARVSTINFMLKIKMLLSWFIESLSHPCLSVLCAVWVGVSELVITGWSAPAVAHYWGYLRSANAPFIVRSSEILCVPVLLLVLSPDVFWSLPWLRRIRLLDLAAHCVPAPVFHPRCARAPTLPVTLFVLWINCCISAIKSFSWFHNRRIWPSMDSAEALTIQGLLENNNARLDRQDEQIFATGRAVQALVAQVSELTTQLQQLRMPAAPLPPPVSPAPLNSATQREPRLPAPEAYNGEPNLCRAFLVNCSMFFSLQLQTFATEESKVALVLTLLSGKAALWGRRLYGERRCGKIIIPAVPRLSREERERRRARGLCLYCGALGHFLAECPVKP